MQTKIKYLSYCFQNKIVKLQDTFYEKQLQIQIISLERDFVWLMITDEGSVPEMRNGPHC